MRNPMLATRITKLKSCEPPSNCCRVCRSAESQSDAITRTITMKKKQPAKSKKKPAPIAKEEKKPAQIANTEVEPAKAKKKPVPIANTEVEPAQKKLSKKQTPGKVEASTPMRLDPTNTRMSLILWPALRVRWLAKVYEQHPASSYGHYDKARASAWAAQGKFSPLYVDALPLPLDEIPASNVPGEERQDKMAIKALKMAYYEEDGDWLKGCRKNILAAVDAGDEKFFLELAAFIRNRPKFRGKSVMGWRATRYGDPLPTLRTDVCRRLMASYWVDWPLWLMPDAVGCAYLNKFTGEKMTEANYKKIRQKLRLFQHPERPVNNFTDEGEPMVRLGWKFPKS